MSELPSFLKFVDLSIFGPDESAVMTVNTGALRWYKNQIIKDDPVLLNEGDVVIVVGTHDTGREMYKIVDTPYGSQALLPESLKVLPAKSPDTVD